MITALEDLKQLQCRALNVFRGMAAFMVRSPTYREIGVKIGTTVSWTNY